MWSLVGAAALVVAVLWFAQRSLIYFPSSDLPPPAAVGLRHAEAVSFSTEDGLRLDAWLVPAIGPASGYTILAFGGNGGHRGLSAEFAAQLSARGHAVLLVDYRGYGGNPGLPSETGLTRDARAALAYAGARPGVDVTRLVFFGSSLGAAVAVRLALEYPPAALILRSPFTSMADIGHLHYPFLPVRWLLRDRYPSIDRIAGVTSPLLVIAGALDRIVPPEDSEALFEAAPCPKQLIIIEGAAHNDERLAHGPELIGAIAGFLGASPGRGAGG